MENESVSWPSVYATSEDKGIIESIRKKTGYFQNIEMRYLLLIAASIAVKKDLEYDDGFNVKRSSMSETVSYANLNRDNYKAYRQYIAAIYFLTKANKSIDSMGDVSEMVRNFEDYAHRGICFLRIHYLDNNMGNEELFNDYTKLMKECVDKIKEKEKTESIQQ